MKTGGEKHNNAKLPWGGTDTDWDLITPPEILGISQKSAKRKRKNIKKDRIKGYKRRARRMAKKIKDFFLSGKDDAY